MSVVTITFGQGAENSRGMQKLGTLASKGYNRQDLIVFQSNFEKAGYKCELVNLNQPFPVESDDACVLVVRKGVNAIIYPDYSGSDLFQELLKLNWDTKFLNYGKVMNKKARYNLCFSEQAQEPDYEAGKGRIIPWKDVPILTRSRKQLGVFVKGGEELLAEGNYYYDVNKCGVKFHGDDQRKKVIGIRLAHGKCPPIHYQWFIFGKPIGQRVIIQLNDQDLYIMSEKASGNDAHLKNKPILKHATGSAKFTEID